MMADLLRKVAKAAEKSTVVIYSGVFGRHEVIEAPAFMFELEKLADEEEKKLQANGRWHTD